MVVEIIVVCILAKCRRYKLKYLFRTWTFYPILLMQLVLVAFQASIFLRRFIFVAFVPYTEMAVILSFLFAAFAFQLYKPALWGTACILAGTGLNRLAIGQNAGKMPVFPSLSYLTGYVTPEIVRTGDALHVLGSTETRLKFLTDYIDYGYCILSPGDVLIHIFVGIMLNSLIRAVNLRYVGRTIDDR